MARKKFIYNDTKFDSAEEITFTYWLEEAKELGYVEKWKYQPNSFELFDKVTVIKEVQLKTKVKHVEETVLRPHIYTADYKIWFTDKIKEFDTKLKNIKLLDNLIVYIDIKGGFGSFGSHANFSVEAKWTWTIYNILVEKLICDKFFKQTWVPEKCRLSPVMKQPRKKYINKGYKTYEEVRTKKNN